jgi:alkylation response protein AidB-like acyl-CoA dehydrogenase
VSTTERGMGLGLRALNNLAGSSLLDRTHLREPAQRLLLRGTRAGFRTAAAASRTFERAAALAGPARQRPHHTAGLFDLTPDEDQQMLSGMIGEFAAEKIRAAASGANEACATPPELLSEAGELGLTTLGIPEELGGVMAERSAVTGVLLAEALAHGDVGIALAALAPGAVATTIGLWGDAGQQATYLPSFTSEHPPAAALALLEPRALFDPMVLQASARRSGDDWVLSAVKALVPRGAEAELFLVAADAEGLGPALFILESGSPGVSVEPDPAMGLRAAATGRLILEDVRLPPGSLLAAGRREVYEECVQRARIAWCAVAVGAAQAVLDYVIPYVNERVAFGQPISSRQAVAFAVADIAIELEGMRLLTYRAASRADRGESFARDAALAACMTQEKAVRIGSEGVQLLGGHGYVKEHPVERWYRDLRAAGVMEGALLV